MLTVDTHINRVEDSFLFHILDQFLPRNLSVTRMPLPSAREVSNTCSTEMAHDTERAINALFTTFAQFIDHDLSSAANGKDDEGKPINCQCEEKVTNPFCLNIPTPDMPDQACMLFPRSTDLFRREPGCQQSRDVFAPTRAG